MGFILKQFPYLHVFNPHLHVFNPLHFTLTDRPLGSAAVATRMGGDVLFIVCVFILYITMKFLITTITSFSYSHFIHILFLKYYYFHIYILFLYFSYSSQKYHDDSPENKQEVFKQEIIKNKKNKN